MDKDLVGTSPYKATLTREQFLFHEMRTTARLKNEGLTDAEIVEKVVAGNLFQYPTEKSVKRIAQSCIARLNAMGNDTLVKAIAEQPATVARQICLYAMMRHSRLVWDFMITVIGGKFRTQDLSFSRKNINVFFIQLQEQDDAVAAWSESTVERIKSVLSSVLIENGYLDHPRANHLNPVWLSSVLESGIRANGDLSALPAFNCFS